MISERNADLFMDLFPGDENKMAAAKFCKTFKRGFKLFNTTINSNSTDPANAMFREYLDEQKQILQDFLWYFENWTNIGQCIFHHGGIIAIKGLLKLHDIFSTYFVL